MKYSLFFISIAFVIGSCESAGFEKDKRQIAAKDVIREKLQKARNFDILRFREDTLSEWTDTLFKRPIRYTLDFVYTDSTGTVQNKTGVVLFTPDGRSMIEAQITNPNQ